jgi:hypothetical protein
MMQDGDIRLGDNPKRKERGKENLDLGNLWDGKEKKRRTPI